MTSATKDTLAGVASRVADSGSESNLSTVKDDAYDLYKQTEDVEITKEEEKSVLRIIDMRVMPLLFFMYTLQYLDKNAINFASAFGFKKAMNLSDSDFSWLGSIFYFGYLIAQYPASWAMQRFPTAKFLAIATLGWGVVLITTPACTNFAGIAVNRFLLGVLEGPINPGFVLMMSMFYTTREQPLRLEIYYCTNGLSTMFGGLIGYASGQIHGALEQWMYIFLFFGAASFVVGVCALLFLPDSLTHARVVGKFLTPHQAGIAVKRVSGNNQGVKNKHFKKSQAIEAALDPKTWILVISSIGAQIPNAALTTFGSLILKSFGFGTLETQYMQIPGGAVQFVALISGGIICSKWPGYRCITMTTANLICITGSGMLVALPVENKWGRIVGLWMCFFQGLSFSMMLTMVSSNIAGYTKKQVTGAALFVGYCIGNIIGPQTFTTDSEGGYSTAYIAMLVGYVVKTIGILTLYAYMWLDNKKRDKEAAAILAELGPEGVAAAEAATREEGMLDRTEIENRGFRYTL